MKPLLSLAVKEKPPSCPKPRKAAEVTCKVYIKEECFATAQSRNIEYEKAFEQVALTA